MRIAISQQKDSDIPSDKFSVRTFLLVSIFINGYAIVQRTISAYGIGSVFGFSGRKLLGLWPYVTLFIIMAACYVMSFTPIVRFLIKSVNKIYRNITFLKFFNWVLFFIPILFFGYYQLSGLSLRLSDSINPFWLFGNLGLLGAILLWGTKRMSLSHSILVTVAFYGLCLWVIRFIPDINNFPLSLGWSETSRYYYASLFFSPIIYGKWVPLSSLHPSRYLLQSLPFMIPTSPIWIHRLWQVLLWFGANSLAGFALARRLNLRNRWVSFGMACWLFVFMLQGPVYYHLLVVVIIVLFGFNKENLGLSLFFVALASLWAGISRVNWFPVAGMLAVTLYVLEVPQKGKKFWAYWGWPVVAVVTGLALAFGSQAVYAVISGNPPEVFSSSFSSPLFLYRLFPNKAFGPGVITLTLIACFPLIIILLWNILPRFRAWHLLRLLALLSNLGTLMVAGFIVSMKIGGGDNIHNMDAFLALLAVVTAYVEFDRFEQDRKIDLNPKPYLEIVVIILAFMIPTIFAISTLKPIGNYDNEQAWEVINQIQNLIDEIISDGDDVLFIDQRHLLTFDMVRDVVLVPEYEKVFLMEMAMANNADYLNGFWRDIEDHRFSLIVSEILNPIIRPSSDVFGEENNAWVENVSIPVLGSYYSALDFPEYGISVLLPKQ